ncbi:uncharacterized protein VP01_3970g3 [Puccinia sorghi]|uniref:Uncharacterized protein n=1 Tax=Puccinia sorghi TaxID=27349 RepID=A0A0L6US88_9BASI|nr:uncharacterized protein VP01_3970g3 [Puccinia sorghi]
MSNICHKTQLARKKPNYIPIVPEYSKHKHNIKSKKAGKKVTYGKYQLVRGKQVGKPSFLLCFSRRGGLGGLVHTHEWRTICNGKD